MLDSVTLSRPDFQVSLGENEWCSIALTPLVTSWLEKGVSVPTYRLSKNVLTGEREKFSETGNIHEKSPLLPDSDHENCSLCSPSRKPTLAFISVEALATPFLSTILTVRGDEPPNSADEPRLTSTRSISLAGIRVNAPMVPPDCFSPSMSTRIESRDIPRARVPLAPTSTPGNLPSTSPTVITLRFSISWRPNTVFCEAESLRISVSSRAPATSTAWILRVSSAQAFAQSSIENIKYFLVECMSSFIKLCGFKISYTD